MKNSTNASNPFGDRRYHAWNDVMKREKGGRVQKVSVTLANTCPNRDGQRGTGGCTFCNNASFTPSYLKRRDSVTEQLDQGLKFLQRRYNGIAQYIAYFQSYTNTYGDFEQLKMGYTAALAHPRISGLAIGTRPDCLPTPVLDYLAELAQDQIIELELGVESCDDAVLARVNRGHNVACSLDAVERAAKKGLDVTVHVILGLPGEQPGYIQCTAEQLSQWPIKAIKLHQLQMIRGTALTRAWQQNPNVVSLFSLQAYVEALADFAEHLAPHIMLQRLGSEAPPTLSLAPQWSVRLSELAPRLSTELAKRGTWQGCFH